MPVTPTYPGIYIEELPSSSRTITAAPTSIAVFVGYTHPFKTKPENFKQAIQIFNFTEYEREFGGLYTSSIVRNDLAYAVNEFFLNGGSVAYIVGLNAYYQNSPDKNITLPNGLSLIAPPEANIVTGVDIGIKFTALEPTDQTSMQVTIRPSPGNNSIADITISYGSRVETYRGVTLDSNDPNYIEKRLGTTAKPVSALVTVAPDNVYGTAFTKADQTPLLSSPPADPTTFSAGDFVNVFQADSALDKVPIFNLLVIPGIADNGIWSTALAFCERKQAFAILDPPEQAAADSSSPGRPLIADLMDSVIPKSQNGAIYFPYLLSNDPLTGQTVPRPPSGFVAGIYARTDLNRGVWKAPAGLETTILNTTGVVEWGRMTDARQGTLNPKGINCIRAFPGIGSVVYGARTLVAENVAFQQWKYVPVRRIALFIEQTLIRNLGWVVFEPNDEPLWLAIRNSIEGFMLSLFNQGAFQGSKPSEAFRVKCDKSTTTQTDIDNGIVNIIVAFAPLKPAEFVIVKIAQLAGQVQS